MSTAQYQNRQLTAWFYQANERHKVTLSELWRDKGNQVSILNPKPSTLNPKPQTLNPKPQTPNPKP